MIVLNVVALLFVLFHAVTWFNLTPQAMVVRLRGRRRAVARHPRRATTLGWVAVSAFVAWLVVG